MVSQLNTWVKSQFSIDEALGTEYFDFAVIWNNFVDAWNEDYSWVSGNLFGGTKVTLVKLEVSVQFPVSINIPFFGDIDFWDAIITFMYWKLIPSVTLLGFSIPVGPFGYWISRNARVPFFGSDDIFKLQQSGATKFGNLNPGFTVKDASYDMSKFWILGNLMKMLGTRGIALLMQLIFFINRYRQPKMDDIILRISPSGASLKFDDDTELSIREEMNYMINYVLHYMKYNLDPFHNTYPASPDNEAMKEEPDIGD